MNTIEILESELDPFKILGLSFGAGISEIEQSWNALSEETKQRDEYKKAYTMIGNSESREIFLLLSPAAPEDLDDLPREIPRKARYSGPGIWYRTLAKWLENEDTD